MGRSQLAWSRRLVASAFVLSGAAALTYQLVWQRVLLTLYGSNLESVAMVSSAFLVGLGAGSLVGGHCAGRAGFPLIAGFAACELGAGLYGVVSLPFFQWVGDHTAVGRSMWATGGLAFGLIAVPTLLMGATLPLLVEYFVRLDHDVREAVGSLYAVNTIGGAAGAVFAVMFLIGTFGLQGSVYLAAALNVTIVCMVAVLIVRQRRAEIVP